jgi:antitoxin ParD1/3/4
MTITLTPELEKFVAEQIKNGAYRSIDDIIVQSLGMLQAKEEYERRLAELRGEVDRGLEQAKRGELLDADEVFEKIMETDRSAPSPSRRA